MSRLARIALCVWLAGLAWFAFALAYLGLCEVSDRTGATLGGISGIVALVGGTAGCVAFCAGKDE